MRWTPGNRGNIEDRRGGGGIGMVPMGIGGFILLISGILFLTVLIRGQRSAASEAGAYRFAVPLHMPARIPAALNSFGLWLALMIGLTVVNYGYPIAQLMVLKETNVPAVYVGASR